MISQTPWVHIVADSLHFPHISPVMSTEITPKLQKNVGERLPHFFPQGAGSPGPKRPPHAAPRSPLRPAPPPPSPPPASAPPQKKMSRDK
eukprot:gene13562-biopygen8035